MKIYLFSDSHFNHDEEGGTMFTYCLRPQNFSERIIKQWNSTVSDEDFVWHLGDVAVGNKNAERGIKELMDSLKGRKGLVMGNHDRGKSATWWMENGFDVAVESAVVRNVLLTHEPAERLMPHTYLNVHGHLHNIWSGFSSPEHKKRNLKMFGSENPTRLKHPWQRLFAVEYTDYRPVEFNKFISHPEKYQATGPKKTESNAANPDSTPVYRRTSKTIDQSILPELS